MVAAASVSPSSGSGDGSFLRSAIAYSECVNVRSSEASENQSFTGPAWSDAITYRYRPLRSKTGSLTSVSPSVMRNDLRCAIEYTWTIWIRPLLFCVYASHCESGDQLCEMNGVWPKYSFCAMRVARPVSRSSTNRLYALSRNDTRFSSGDHLRSR